jgi:iron(III) transport system permease protein
VPNPFSFVYGTLAILVLANVIHFFTVGYVTAATALKQLDREFESISASLRVPFYRTFWRVTLPLCLPAVLEIALYFFVNAMVTVSAVIFLYSPQFRLASVAIVNMDDAGNTASAAAMSTLLIAASILVRLVYSACLFQVSRRTQHWRAPA